MFKRLTKARRHSADEAAGRSPLPSPLALDEPPGRKGSEGQLAGYARAKLGRKSCGDAYALLRQPEDDEPGRLEPEADYRLVTAVPAFIVEHEPEKQRGLGAWGLRRMSKKIDSFRRSSSRETICTIPERPDGGGLTGSDGSSAGREDKPTTQQQPGDKKPAAERKFFQSAGRSPSPFKSFFIRMGSTGMLNSSSSKAAGRRTSQNLEDKFNRPSEKDNLFRSCSTSQLNTSPTYVKGDDPSEGIDLRSMIGAAKREQHGKTVSCDNLSGQQSSEDDVFEDSPGRARSFAPCDYTDPAGRAEFMKKSSSCDFKETKKTNFPYAFLRSRLSVLPEERNYGNAPTSAGPKEERLFKTASEEHFPAMKIEDSFDGTTTLGRRRSSRNAGGAGYPVGRDSQRYRLHQQPEPSSRSARNSYSEYRDEQFQRYEPKELRYLGPVSLATMQNGHLDESCRHSISLPYQGSGSDRPELGDVSSLNLDLSYESSSTGSIVNSSSALLRSHRRNSAPSGEQRLSQHYVSSNESGYDSDGPRGESAASETEALSLKCTDSSDTSSVVDSELEKPMRSSTPSECPEQEPKESAGKQQHQQQMGCGLGYLDERLEGSSSSSSSDGGILDGLRWHQSNSGRLLPSIHQSNSSGSPSISPSSSSSSSNSMSATLKIPGAVAGMDQLGIQAAAHRVRLQQDKTRFLSDIIQPAKRIRRCRMIQLNKSGPKESLGIRLAQQRLAEMRYVVVQLETDGIAHRDGRLRLGDEIVEVEGKDLRCLSSLEEVQEFLRSCEGTQVRLKTAYEESPPQIYLADAEYLENGRNLSSLSLIDEPTTSPKQPCEPKAQKRPDYLALDSAATSETASLNGHQHQQQQQQQYATRHVARFEKGLGKPSLGFSVVGGRDSPRGEMGIYVRRVFPGGQADVSKALFQGDEILSLNGKTLKGCTHQEVIELFKAVREGSIELELARRHRYHKAPLKSAPY